MDFNRNEWKKLFETDPKAFEEKRREAIEECIASAGSPEKQKKLRQLQWQIDMEIRKSKNSLAACVKLNDMLMEQVYKEGGFLDALKMFGNPKSHNSDPNLKIVK